MTADYAAGHIPSHETCLESHRPPGHNTIKIELISLVSIPEAAGDTIKLVEFAKLFDTLNHFIVLFDHSFQRKISMILNLSNATNYFQQRL